MHERIVKIKAVDWTHFPKETDMRDSDYTPMIGWVHGQVVKETREYISVAHETFDDGTARDVTTVPKKVIVEITEFARAKIPKRKKKVK